MRQDVIRHNRDLRKTNIPSMFFSTALAMIVTELTGVITVLIDGVIASRFLGGDVYSGIALVKPFSSIVAVFGGFFSTGCMVVCSRCIGHGKQEETNGSFNLSIALTLLFSALLFVSCTLFPKTLLRLCGVSLTKYPELHPHMYGYLSGYMIGMPAAMLVRVLSPVVVMDSGEKRFSLSSFVLFAADILGDLAVAFVFRSGAFGMGLATSVSYILQLLILLSHFFGKGCYFRLSPRYLRAGSLKDLALGGASTLIKRLSGTLRDVLTNSINIQVAVTAAAIAARGIQGDFFQFLFCISSGLGRTLLTMAGLYYGANDLISLKRLYKSALQFGLVLSGTAALCAFFASNLLPRIYTDDLQVLSLAAFSIRWTAVGLVFDTFLVLVQHFFEGTGNVRAAGILSVLERLILPVGSAFVCGSLFGTRGVLASGTIGKMLLTGFIFLYACVRKGGLPRSVQDIMFLPKGFGGLRKNNLYAEIRTRKDAIRASEKTDRFCRAHGASPRLSMLVALCVEEMAINVIDHAETAGLSGVSADLRLFADEEDIRFSLMDLSDAFDPTAFYELHHADSPEKHIGIRMVMRMAQEVRYFRTYSSNNLVVRLREAERDEKSRREAAESL